MQKTLMLMVCRIVFLITVAFGLVPISGFAQDYPSGESGDQRSYPGISPTQGKLEGTLGSYNLRAYGIVFFQPQRAAELNGRVREAGGQKTVPFAWVRLQGPGVVASDEFTNVDGRFRFTGITAGPYTIEVICPGFETVSISVDVLGMNHPEQLEIELKPSAVIPQGRLVASAAELMIPKSARREFERARDEQKHSNCERALVHLERAIREYARYASAHNAMGNCYAELHDLDRAEQSFKRGIEFGTSIYPYLNLADVYVKQRRFEDARSVLRLAMHSNGGQGDLYYALANTYFVESRLDEAEAAALEADSRIHRIPDLHLLLAKIYLRRNNAPAIVEQLKAYLKEAPHSPLTEQIQRSLKEFQR